MFEHLKLRHIVLIFVMAMRGKKGTFLSLNSVEVSAERRLDL